MKKINFLLSILILPIACAASNYRGMFEVGGGPIFAKEKIHTSTGNFRNKQTSIGAMFSTSHGCQFTPWLFAGAGVGFNLECMKSPKSASENSTGFYTSKKTLISIPLFVDVRWDLDMNREFTPYADLRLGYQLGMDGYVRYRAQSISNPSYIAVGSIKSADGMYVQASAGVRWKMGNNAGVNLGVSFIPTLRREILIGVPLYCNRNYLLLNVGFDIQGKGKSSLKEDRKAKLYRLQQQRLKKQAKKIDFQ
ncbi:MAG: hypothetical protein K2N35_12555 [Muribaculaceae bacterium]|nr:hypothetical protein [Muribaculaceae bacterium]